jgi:hypothetical protein
MSGSVARIDGAHTNGTLCGFILDVVVVRGLGRSQLVLAFNVLALHPETEFLCVPKKIGCEQSSLVRVEKRVQCLMNKVTTVNFEKLSNQICDIPIMNIEMWMPFGNSVDKNAVSMPAFSDLYAKLCVHLAANERIIHIIECDENPLTCKRDSVSNCSTNAVSTNDAKIKGPFENE